MATRQLSSIAMARRRVSVAEAAKHLPSLIAELAASGTPIEITRRGKTVAVLVSAAEYDRASEPEGLVAGLARIRAKYGGDLGFTEDEVRSLRTDVSARQFALDEK